MSLSQPHCWWEHTTAPTHSLELSLRSGVELSSRQHGVPGGSLCAQLLGQRKARMIQKMERLRAGCGKKEAEVGQGEGKTDRDGETPRTTAWADSNTMERDRDG